MEPNFKEIINSIKFTDLLKIITNTFISTFLYYPQEKIIQISPRSSEIYKINKTYTLAPESLIESVICDEDKQKFYDMYRKIDNGEDMVCFTGKNKLANSQDKIVLKTIKRDENNKPTLVLGLIEKLNSDALVNNNISSQIESNFSNFSNQDLDNSNTLNKIALAIGSLYYALYYIDIREHSYVCYLEKLQGILSIIGTKGNYEKSWDNYINLYIVEEDRADVRTFIDLKTLPKRLEKQNSINITYRRIGVGWTRGQFIVANRDENKNITHVIYTVTDINYEMDMAKIREQAIFDSYHDPLTNFYNRKKFNEVINSPTITNSSIGYFMIDIDSFKQINDTYGHDIGDKVLVIVTNALNELFKEEDFKFRIGGDEFSIILTHPNEYSWKIICSKLKRIHISINSDIKNTIDIANFPKISLSMGIYIAKNGYNNDVYLLADEALYQTKHNGKAGCTLINTQHKIVNQWFDESFSHTNLYNTNEDTGIYRLEFPNDKNQEPKMLCSESTKISLGVSTNATPEQCYKALVNGIDKSYYDILYKTRDIMFQSKRAECCYDYHHPLLGTIKVRSGGTGEITKRAKVLYGYFHLLNDIEIIKKDDESEALINALSSAYFCAYYINTINDTYCTYKTTKKGYALEASSGKASSAINFYIENLVSPEFKEKMTAFCDIKTIAERLKNDQFLDCEYKSTTNKGWCRARYTCVKRNSNNEATDVLFLVSSIDSKKQQELAEKQRVNNLLELNYVASNLVKNTNILYIALIDKETSKARLWLKESNFQIENIVDFNESIKHDVLYTDPTRQSEYLEAISLKTIKEKLSHNSHYEYRVNMINKYGQQQLFKYHFKTYPNNPKYILDVFEDITEKSAYDQVTDSFNMTGFIYHVNYKLHTNSNDISYAILCFNIQNFKAINNQYGYEGGDKILKEVYLNLKNSNINPIIVCRENADNFFCFVARDNLTNEKVTNLCSSKIKIGKINMTLKMNCGVYLIDNLSDDVIEMCDRARIALVVSSNTPMSHYTIYSKNMNKEYLENAYVLSNFYGAMQTKQFIAVYQPIYDAKTLKIVSAEALIRWNHPKNGLLSPGTFIPVLEHNGYISELDNYLCEIVYDLQKSRLAQNLPMVPIAINLSRYDLFNYKIISSILKELNNHPEICKYLHFEITESGFTNIPDEGKMFISAIRKLGSKVLIDDFGSGYSSLSTLGDIPCDFVKLDMTFIKKIGKSTSTELIIKSCIYSMHQMGMKLIAEGVENKEQYGFLLENNCDYIQGFYFSNPVEESKFNQLLEENN